MGSVVEPGVTMVVVANFLETGAEIAKELEEAG